MRSEQAPHERQGLISVVVEIKRGARRVPPGKHDHIGRLGTR
jgi:hypothetical protein